jgi:hypothetical protein
MDCTNMKFPSDYFDLIIDKSTIDALLCGDNAFLNTALMLKVINILTQFLNRNVREF